MRRGRENRLGNRLASIDRGCKAAPDLIGIDGRPVFICASGLTLEELTMGLLNLGSTQGKRQRYYLLAGMGGRSARRKDRTLFVYAMLAAAMVSCLLAGLFLLINAF